MAVNIKYLFKMGSDGSAESGRWVRSFLVAFVILSSMTSLTTAATRDLERVRIGYSVGGLIPFPLIVAKENRFFEQAGLEVELINIPPTIAVTALISGDIQYVIFAGTTLNAAVRGLPVKLVMVYNDRPLFSLMARADIRSIKELKGKVLGVATLTSGESFLSRRLLKDAGADGLSFVLKNRGIPMPYEPMAIWLIDQWRKVGVNVTQEVIEAAAYYKVLRSGEHEVALDFQCGYIVDPDLDLYKFLSVDKNPANYSRYVDRTLDELYEQQSRASDPEERKKYIRQFEKHLLDDEAHYLMTLQWHRIIPHSAKVQGWKITPSHYLNQQLDTVWLSE